MADEEDSDEALSWTMPPGLTPAQELDWQQARAHATLGRGFRALGREVRANTDMLRPLVASEVRWATIRSEVADSRIGPVRIVSLALFATLFVILWAAAARCGVDPKEISTEARRLLDGECVPPASVDPRFPAARAPTGPATAPVPPSDL